MLTFIPTPIGNIADITIRAMRLFEEAELFLCEDTRETKHLLSLLQERYALKKNEATFLSFNEHNGIERLEQIGGDLKDKNVVYVSDAGMPIISDPGQILVAHCQKNGIAYDVLPGANAALTAFVASGFDSVEFVFMGFLAHKGKEREARLKESLGQKFPAILYEAPHRLLKLLEEIAMLDPNRELFIAKELTKKYQKYYKQSAKDLFEKFKDEHIRGEWVVVVAPKEQSDIKLSLDEILKLDLHPKEKAKLLSQTNGKSPKECYAIIIDGMRK